MKTRIVEVSNGFIVQCREGCFLFGGQWKGVDTKSYKYKEDLWSFPEFQLKWCLCKTKKEAEELEKKFLSYHEDKKKLK